MPYNYAILAFAALAALALASPILKQSPSTAVTRLDLPSTVHGTVSGQDLIAATTTCSPKAIAISSTNATSQRPVSSASPSHVSFSQPQQSRWTPSNILFGCTATFFGAATIGLTYYIYRRQSRSQQSGIVNSEPMELDDIRASEPSDLNDALTTEDVPPPYTSVDASASSVG